MTVTPTRQFVGFRFELVGMISLVVSLLFVLSILFHLNTYLKLVRRSEAREVESNPGKTNAKFIKYFLIISIQR